MTFETEYGALGRSHDSELRTTDRRLGDLEDRVAALEDHSHPPPEPPPVVVVNIDLQPDAASVLAGEQVPLRVLAHYSDGTSAERTAEATYTAEQGVVLGGIYTAPAYAAGDLVTALFDGATDTMRVEVSLPAPPPPPPPPPAPPPSGFPPEYDLTRLPAGALLAGDTWQSYTSDKDLRARSGLRHLNQDIEVTKSAYLVEDPLWGKVPECIQGDWSAVGSKCHDPANPPQTIHPAAVRLTRQWPAVRAAWVRFVVEFVKPFDLATYCKGGTNAAWKYCNFGTGGYLDRHDGVHNSSGHTEDLNQYGASKMVPGPGHMIRDTPQGPKAHWMGGPWTPIWESGEKWEWIIFVERLSSGEYRIFRQRRQITRKGKLDPQPITGDPLGASSRLHLITEGATSTYLPVREWHLSENRNGPTPPGVLRRYRIGPYEIINADVLRDPYGIRKEGGW